MRVGKLPSVEDGETDRLGGGKGRGEGLRVVGGWGGGICPTFSPGFGAGPPAPPWGALELTLADLWGEAPSLAQALQQERTCTSPQRLSKLRFGVHVANPRGPMWTWGGWDRPQPLTAGMWRWGAGWAGPRNLSLGPAPRSPRILALPLSAQPQGASALSGLASLGAPPLLGLWGAPENTAVPTATKMAKTC